MQNLQRTSESSSPDSDEPRRHSTSLTDSLLSAGREDVDRAGSSACRAARAGFPSAYWLIAGYVSVLSLYTWFAPNLLGPRDLVLDVAQVIIPLVSFALCLSASRRAASGRERASWVFLAASMFASTVAEVAWAYFEVVLGVETPTPSVADAAWLVYYPCAVIGLALIVPKELSLLARISTWIDVSLITFGAAFLSWELLIEPSMQGVSDPLLAIINSSWSVGDLMLIAVMSVILLRLPSDRMGAHHLYLLGAFAIQILVDTAYASLVLSGTYTTGSPIDPMWAVSYALVAFSAIAYQTSRESPAILGIRRLFHGRVAHIGRLAFPYLSLPLAAIGWWIDANLQQADSLHGEALLFVIVIASAVLARQFITVFENTRLNRSLFATSQELELRLTELDASNSRLESLADEDPVTGLLNHRSFHQRVDMALRLACRTNSPISVVIIDIDRFKFFNDTYGHQAGDEVIRLFADILRETARTTDAVGRYGGDEFVALLSNTSATGAYEFARRLRVALVERPFVASDGSSVPIQSSFGLASYPDDATEAHDLMAFADANLYESKRRGGDSISAGASDEHGTTRIGPFGVLDGLVTAVDNKDRYTRQHSEDVSRLALMLARYLKLSDEKQGVLRTAGLLHDVGKIGVSDQILRKPGRLTDDEFSIARQHVVLGETIIKALPNLSEVVTAVGSHHERFDGRGYPRGLAGSNIPLLGRVLAVADAFSAMTTDRPYRAAFDRERARSELLEVAGTQLDPGLVHAFLEALDEENDSCDTELATRTIVAGWADVSE